MIGLQGTCIPMFAGFLRQVLDRPPGHPEGGPMHVDGAYTTFRRNHPEFMTLAAIPSLGHQRASRSDIYPLR
jgi:glycosyl transferase, family 25